MSDEIIKLLDDLGRRFGIAIDWSSQNVAPYLKDLMSRYISYEMITSIVWLVVFTIAVMIMGIAIPKLIKYEIKYNESRSCWNEIMWPTVMSVCFGVMIVFCLIGIGCQINHLIICNTIPEQLIVNYISNLM